MPRMNCQSLLERLVGHTLLMLENFRHLLVAGEEVKLCRAVQDVSDWTDTNQLATRKEYTAKMKEFEAVITPTMERLHHTEDWFNWFTNSWGGCACCLCNAPSDGEFPFRYEQ